MNEERLDKLADFIETLPVPGDVPFPFHTFAMETWLHREPGCGTSACIAGWTVELFHNNPLSIRERGEVVVETACELLDLSRVEGYELFQPKRWPKPMRSITPQEAARVVRLVARGTDVVEAWKTIS